MKASSGIAIGLALGLSGGALLLMTAPSFDLPCEVTVSYKGKHFRPNLKHPVLGHVVDVQKAVDLRGTGRIAGSRLICRIDLQKEGI